MPTKPEAPNPPAPKDFAPRKPTPPHAPAPPRLGSAPMPTILSALGRLPAPLPRVDSPSPSSTPHVPASANAAPAPAPAKSDPFPATEAPTPIKRVGPFSKVTFTGQSASQTARTFRNYDALSEENKRLVDALVLALRGMVDGGR